MPPLAKELEAFLADFGQRVPADIRAVMRDADDDLRRTGIENRVLKEGAAAPDFALPDATGRTVRLADRLAAGPVVLTFYRGGWCPYCNLELRAWQRMLSEIDALGARVIAVSPQTPDASLSTAEKNGLAFDVLSDSGSRVAEAYGLAFALPQALRDLYTRFGHPLPAVNGTDDWRLPIPGTFVIAPSGRVLRARADVDYRTRLEPAEALAALRAAVETV
jgi:peroxiredoxin